MSDPHAIARGLHDALAELMTSAVVASVACTGEAPGRLVVGLRLSACGGIVGSKTQARSDAARNEPAVACTMVRIKRAYEPATRDDGYRILIDRLWPRGRRKEDVPLDAWAKELSPSDGLRTWFGHEPSRWRGFVVRYRRELRAPAARAMLDELARRAATGTVTIVYGARDETRNDAVVVRGEIERRIRRRRPRTARVRRRI